MDKLTFFKVFYFSFFTVFNVAVFLMYYIFGFTYDKDLRRTDKRITLPAFTRFLFNFKGTHGTSKSRPTKLCGFCEIFSILYAVVTELGCLCLGFIINDLILPCRLSFAQFVIALAICIVLTGKTKKRIKAQNAIEEIEEIKDYLTPKETIPINDDKIINQFLQEPAEKPKRSFIDPFDFFGEENPDRELTNVGEGMKAVNKFNENPIDEDIQVLQGFISPIDENGNKIPDSVTVGQAPIPEPIFDENNPEREMTDVAEGMKAINELRKNLIEDEDETLFIPPQ